MALRLIDGPDLTRLPEGVPLPPVRAVELVRRIATIVARMHERQWLHCDLKPSNVLVDSRGAPWLTDLAMAQPLAPTARAGDAEHHFALGGTPAFMAPEQFAGDAALLSPASDIFALGGVLGGGEREAHTIFDYGVSATAFPPSLQYVALGHLHRSQAIPGPCPIRYAGSPLQLDFGP